MDATPPASPVTPQPASPRRSRLVIGLVAGLVVVAVVAAAVIVIPRLLGSGTGGQLNPTAAAMPADTQLFIAFNPRYEQLPNGDVIRQAWGDDLSVFQPLEEQTRAGLAGMGLDWEEDIAPWLGDEIGMGMSDLPLVYAADTPPPQLVLAAATRDVSKSNAFLAKLRAAAEFAGVTFSEQTYRGVATVESASGAYATLNDLVIVAAGSDDLHAAIDALLDGTGFGQSANYQASIGQLRGGRALTAFVDFGALLGPLLDQWQTLQPPSPMSLSELNQLQLSMGLSFEPNGVLMEFVTRGDPSVPLPVEAKTGSPAAPNPNRLLHAVPDSTFVYMSGRRLSDWFEGFLESLSQLEAIQPGIQDAIRSFEREIGVDLRKEIFGWMTGEAAVAVMPAGGLVGGAASPFGMALIVEATDKQLAESGPHRLFQALAAQAGGEIEDVTVGDYRLHGLIDPFSGDPVIVYGLMGDNFVLALPKSAAEKMAAAGESPLADDETFKAAIAPLPGNTIGYFYFEPKQIADLVALAASFSGQGCEGCDLLDPIRALAFTIEYPPAEPGAIRSVMFMLLDVEK